MPPRSDYDSQQTRSAERRHSSTANILDRPLRDQHNHWPDFTPPCSATSRRSRDWFFIAANNDAFSSGLGNGCANNGRIANLVDQKENQPGIQAQALGFGTSTMKRDQLLIDSVGFDKRIGHVERHHGYLPVARLVAWASCAAVGLRNRADTYWSGLIRYADPGRSSNRSIASSAPGSFAKLMYS